MIHARALVDERDMMWMRSSSAHEDLAFRPASSTCSALDLPHHTASRGRAFDRSIVAKTVLGCPCPHSEITGQKISTSFHSLRLILEAEMLFGGSRRTLQENDLYSLSAKRWA